MLSILLSALFGVLVSKISDLVSEKRGNKITRPVLFGSCVTYVIALLIYDRLKANYSDNDVFKALQGILNLGNSNLLIQGFLALLTAACIIILDYFPRTSLPFRKYSEKIIKFTESVHEGSTVSIIAGDMNFFGHVKITIDNDNIKSLYNNNSKKAVFPEYMDNSNEYKQLYKLRNAISLRILCNHRLDTETLNAILDETISYQTMYTKYRKNHNLYDNTFQQLLRIGKIKSDFGDSVDIRFYKTNEDDKQLRARFVDNKCIVYKETNHGSISRESLYTLSMLDDHDCIIYKDLFNYKWKECNASQDKTIIRFCELLYHYVINTEVQYRLALVYVNSYEVARKGKQRKEFPPFGVLYLAACIKELPGWKVDLISVDEHTKPQDLTPWDKYDVIGFSIISSYSYSILKRCYDSSKKKKDVVILAGGYQAEKFCNEVFRDFNANIIFKGEGEDSIRSFCRQYPNRNYSKIAGIMYRSDADKTIKATEGRGCVDIDKIPFPARELLPTDDVVMTNRLAQTDLRMVHMLFSRGCPYNCYYCAANQNGHNNTIRYRDKISIVKELLDLKEKYKIQGFSIIDDCFLTDKDKAIEICNYIAENRLNLKWSLAARVDNISDEILAALWSSGCIEIKFGLETASDVLLSSMKKGFDIKLAEDSIRKTKEYGISVKLFIITGLPGETDSTHNATKEFLKRMNSERLVDRVSLLRYTPLAGSYIYDNPHKFGILKGTLGIENFDKIRLYKKSFNWWIEKRRFADCNRWYNDMQEFITETWGDK